MPYRKEACLKSQNIGYLTVVLSNQGQITFLPGVLVPQPGLEFPYHKEVIPGCLLFVGSETSLLPSRIEPSFSRARGSHHLPFREQEDRATQAFALFPWVSPSPLGHFLFLLWPWPLRLVHSGMICCLLSFSVTSLHSHREVLGSLSLKPQTLWVLCVCVCVCVCVYVFPAVPRGMRDLSSPTRD